MSLTSDEQKAISEVVPKILRAVDAIPGRIKDVANVIGVMKCELLAVRDAQTYWIFRKEVPKVVSKEIPKELQKKIGMPDWDAADRVRLIEENDFPRNPSVPSKYSTYFNASNSCTAIALAFRLLHVRGYQMRINGNTISDVAIAVGHFGRIDRRKLPNPLLLSMNGGRVHTVIAPDIGGLYRHQWLILKMNGPWAPGEGVVRVDATVAQFMMDTKFADVEISVDDVLSTEYEYIVRKVTRPDEKQLIDDIELTFTTH
jgi:hypothetical protein